MKAILIGISKKAKQKNTRKDKYVDGEEYIKAFVTKYNLENKHFNFVGIVFLMKPTESLIKPLNKSVQNTLYSK